MEGRKLYVMNGLFVFAVGVLLWLLVTWTSPWNAQRYVGTVLAVLGISLIGVVRYQLGKSFSVRAEAHHLVTTGVYSKIRNPIYVFGIVMLLGLTLVLQVPTMWVFSWSWPPRRPSAPAGRLECWKLRSGMHTGITGARRGSREPVFAARAVEDVISHQ